MHPEKLILLVTYLGSAAVMIACGIPMYRRTLRPNKWMGFRTRVTLNDDRVWFEANHAAGRWLIISGIGTGLSAISAAAIGMNELESAVLVTAAMLAGVALSLWAGYSAEKRFTAENGTAKPD